MSPARPGPGCLSAGRTSPAGPGTARRQKKENNYSDGREKMCEVTDVLRRRERESGKDEVPANSYLSRPLLIVNFCRACIYLWLVQLLQLQKRKHSCVK